MFWGIHNLTWLAVCQIWALSLQMFEGFLPCKGKLITVLWISPAWTAFFWVDIGKAFMNCGERVNKLGIWKTLQVKLLHCQWFILMLTFLAFLWFTLVIFLGALEAIHSIAYSTLPWKHVPSWTVNTPIKFLDEFNFLFDSLIWHLFRLKVQFLSYFNFVSQILWW